MGPALQVALDREPIRYDGKRHDFDRQKRSGGGATRDEDKDTGPPTVRHSVT